MAEIDRIAAALRRCLKERGMTYADLAKRIGVAEVSVKRLFSKRAFSVKRLEQVCAALDLDIYSVAKLARGDGERLQELTIEQEQALAKDARLITLFHLLLHDWTAREVLREFAITEPEVIRLLAKLERLKLIDLLPGNRVKLRCPQRFSWRSDGPVRRRYQAAALGEYLSADFRGENQLLRLEVRELTPASLAVLKRKLERVAVEFNELAEVDSQIAIENRQSVGLVLAIRPWVFSVVSALRRKEGRAG
jgi:transcriptional regulator with XRE-family HTH domain